MNSTHADAINNRSLKCFICLDPISSEYWDQPLLLDHSVISNVFNLILKDFPFQPREIEQFTQVPYCPNCTETLIHVDVLQKSLSSYITFITSSVIRNYDWIGNDEAEIGLDSSTADFSELEIEYQYPKRNLGKKTPVLENSEADNFDSDYEAEEEDDDDVDLDPDYMDESKNSRAFKLRKPQLTVASETIISNQNNVSTPSKKEKNIKTKANAKPARRYKRQPCHCPHKECPKSAPDSFGHRIALREHLVSVHGKKGNYECPYCKKQFTTKKSKYYAHISSHEKGTKEKKYSCNICGLKFTNPWNLKRHHLQFHNGEKRYQCQIESCQQSFRHLYQRNIHLVEDHLGTPEAQNTKCIQCPICSIYFPAKSTLELHMRRHKTPNKRRTTRIPKISIPRRINETNKCHACDMLFKTGILLRVHFETNKCGGENFKEDIQYLKKYCKICGARHQTKKSLYLHYKEQHQLVYNCLTGKFTALKLNKIETSGIIGDAVPESRIIDQNQSDKISEQEEIRKKNSSNFKYICEICNLRIQRKQRLLSHYKKEHQKVCNEETGELSPLSFVTVAASNHTNNLPTNRRGRGSPRKTTINLPAKKRREGQRKIKIFKYFCKICNIRIQRKLELYNHYKKTHQMLHVFETDELIPINIDTVQDEIVKEEVIKEENEPQVSNFAQIEFLKILDKGGWKEDIDVMDEGADVDGI